MGLAFPHTSTSSIRLLWPFLELSRKHGYNVSSVASSLGLEPQELDDPETRVPQWLLAKLLQDAIDLSGERDIGLLAARWADSRVFGIGEYIARTRPTLREAIELYDRYLPLLGDGAGLSVEHVENTVVMRLWFSPELVIHESAYEFALAIGALRARRVTGDANLAPLSVHFMHQRPPDTTRHERMFRCPIHFNAEITQVVLPARALDLKLPGVEPVLNELLARQADTMLAQLPRANDVISQVRTLLGGEEQLTEASASRIAKRLGMSRRTLSRKLEHEGTGFRAVIDDVRKSVALRELAHDACSIAELAYRLGFSTPQGFHRAFRRWTGTTAAETRRNARKRPQGK